MRALTQILVAAILLGLLLTGLWFQLRSSAPPLSGGAVVADGELADSDEPLDDALVLPILGTQPRRTSEIEPRDTVAMASVPADATGSTRIHGTVTSVHGEPIANGIVELEYSDRKGTLSTKTSIDGEYTFWIEPVGRVARRAPTRLQVRAIGFVAASKSLWTDRSGYSLEDHATRVDFALQVGQVILLSLVFDDGTPAGNVSVGLIPMMAMESLWGLETEPEFTGATDDDGLVEFADLPSHGLYQVVISLDGLPDWFRVPIDMRPGQERTIVVPVPYTLRIGLDEGCKPRDASQRARPYVHVLADGGRHTTVSHADPDGRFTVTGLRPGDVLELRLLWQPGAYRVLTQGLAITERSQTIDFDCRDLPFVARESRLRTQDGRPFYVSWRLVDGHGAPITGERLEYMNLDGFECTWRTESDRGRLRLSGYSTNPGTRGVRGDWDLPVDPPVTVTVTGYGLTKDTLVKRRFQVVDVTLPVDSLAERAAQVVFHGQSRTRGLVRVSVLDLTHRGSGQTYRAHSRSSRRTSSIKMALPPGTYDYQAANMEDGVAFGQFVVTPGEVQTVFADFAGHGSVQGRVAPPGIVIEVVLSLHGLAATTSAGIESVRPLSDGRFIFRNIVAGEYSITLRASSDGLPTLQTYADTLHVRAGELNDVGVWALEQNPSADVILRMRGAERAHIDVWVEAERRFRGWFALDDTLALARGERARVFLIEDDGGWRGVLECEQVVDRSVRLFVVPE